MKTKYRLDKSFGPVGSSAGSLLFVVGLVITYTSFYGLILMVLGAFVGFSSTYSIIDFEKKRIKFSNTLFGIIESGNWIQLEKSMKIGIKESNITWSAFSRGNRSLDINNKDFRLTLLDSNNKEIMEIRKNDSIESAKMEQDKLARQLGIINF
jgi:hypothetical protein